MGEMHHVHDIFQHGNAVASGTILFLPGRSSKKMSAAISMVVLPPASSSGTDVFREETIATKNEWREKVAFYVLSHELSIPTSQIMDIRCWVISREMLVPHR